MTKRMNITETIAATISGSERTRLQESAYGSTSLPDKIITVVEGIHSGLTRNNTFYPSETLEASQISWTSPYNKPVIKNHDESTEPLGRVIRATYKQSNIVPDKQTLELELEITDKDAIQKVLDGRYRTLSIGGSAGSVACSVCAKDQVSEGFCGHNKGRTYEGVVAHWIISDLQFDEISWVNVPADVNAQVVQKDASQQMESAENGQGGSELDENVLDQIDNLRGSTIVTEGVDEASTVDETTDAAATTENTDEQPAGEDAGNTNEVTEATIEEKLTVAEAQIKTLESENTTLVAERDTLQLKVDEQEVDLTALREQLATANQAKEDAVGEKAELVKQNTTLATYTHRVLAENLTDMQVVLGKTEEGAKAQTIETLLKESSRSLKEKIAELSKERPVRIVQTVESPATSGDADVREATSKEEEVQTFTIQTVAELLNAAMQPKRN